MKTRLLSYNIRIFDTRAAVWAALICLVLAAASCRGYREVVKEVQVPIHDTTYVTKIEKDSVYIETSVKEFVKGDTMFLVKTLTKYVEKLKTDTVSVYVEKPIEIVKTEVKTVDKQLAWWQKTLMYIGGFFIIGVVSFFILLILKTKT